MKKCSRTVVFVTIGCRLNQADSALMADRLRNAGYIITETENGTPDVIIMNTCSVTGTAARKSRQSLRQLRRKNPDACIIVTGCSADIEKDFWENESSADIVIVNEGKKKILEYLDAFFNKTPFENINVSANDAVFHEDASAYFPFKSRAFLKIQEGCNSFCSYCIVPYARGRERSRDWTEVIAEFKSLLNNGHKEIILSGVNTCTYKCDGRTLPDLLSELCSFDGDYRVRLSSTEPHPCNRDLLKVMAENKDKVCRFLHLPLQHGTDEILKKMNRKYSLAEYAGLVNLARSEINDIHIGTDIIVGFPGETENLFGQMLEFVRNMNFSNAHIFTFSPRKGTPAAAMNGKVPEREMKERAACLSSITSDSAKRFAASQLGQPLKILVERTHDGVASGWSDNYLTCNIQDSTVLKNSICEAVAFNMNADLSIDCKIPGK